MDDQDPVNLDRVSPLLKGMLLCIAMAMIGFLTLLIHQQLTAPDPTDYSAPHVLNNEAAKL